jgi:hypothetical protein
VGSKEFVAYLNNIRYATYTNACAYVACQALFLKRGDYGSTFVLSDGRVGKIYKVHDKAYRAFVAMLVTSENQHLPKIYDLGIADKFAWVVLEFVEPVCEKTLGLSFKQVACGLSSIIMGREPSISLPKSIVDLGLELKDYGKGFCLDFKRDNFGMRGFTFISLDPFCLRTKHNGDLDYLS